MGKCAFRVVYPNAIIPIVPFLVMYTLRIFGVVRISWIDVTSPLWIYFFWCLGMTVIAFVYAKLSERSGNGKR